MRSRWPRRATACCIHDRRNCGASDVSFDGSKSEYEVWADDLHALLKQLGMLPAIIGGTSSGARLSLLLALRYPQDVRALVLWRITGGEFAIKRLTEKYYDQYIRLAEQGGMAAVCGEEHFAERIRERPGNRERLMALDPKDFVATLRAWREPFAASTDLPLIGTTEADLRSITIPTCIIPGDDLTHGSVHAATAARLHAELRTAQPDHRRPRRRHHAAGGMDRARAGDRENLRRLPRPQAAAGTGRRAALRDGGKCRRQRLRSRTRPPDCRTSPTWLSGAAATPGASLLAAFQAATALTI